VKSEIQGLSLYQTFNKKQYSCKSNKYTGCLAQGAYYITSNGEAAIIDPLREVQPTLTA
jgi:hypothetical protein